MLLQLHKELRNLRGKGQSDLSITVLVADRGNPAHLDHFDLLPVGAVVLDVPDVAIEQVFLSVPQLLIGSGRVQPELFGKVYGQDPNRLPGQGGRLGRQLRHRHGHQPLLTKVQAMGRTHQRVVHRDITAGWQLLGGSIFARSSHCERFRANTRQFFNLAHTRNLSQ